MANLIHSHRFASHSLHRLHGSGLAVATAQAVEALQTLGDTEVLERLRIGMDQPFRQFPLVKFIKSKSCFYEAKEEHQNLSIGSIFAYIFSLLCCCLRFCEATFLKDFQKHQGASVSECISEPWRNLKS